MRENYVVVVFIMQEPHPYFEWNRLLRYRRIFLEKSDGNKARKCRFLLGLANLRCVFAKLLMYEHYSYKKDV